MKTGKYLHYMNYENIYLQYTIHENMKIFVCKTWILKKRGNVHLKHELWKNLNICLQNMNYENI